MCGRSKQFGPLTLWPALVVTNSEVASGALATRMAVYSLPCTNTMVWVQPIIKNYEQERSLRAVHRGSDLQRWAHKQAVWPIDPELLRLPDPEEYRQRVEDSIKRALDPVTFDGLVATLRQAATVKIVPEEAESVVENLGDRHGLTRDERDAILEHLRSDGDLSKLGLGNAITRHAQDVGSYERTQSLEKLGATVTQMNKAEWTGLLREQRRPRRRPTRISEDFT